MNKIEKVVIGLNYIIGVYEVGLGGYFRDWLLIIIGLSFIVLARVQEKIWGRK